VIIIENTSDFNGEYPTVVTIGTFDGVHLGHKKIIDKLISSAAGNRLKTTILTFFPHPRMVLQQNNDLKLITTLEEKKSILEDAGLDQLLVYPFTKEFSRLSALEFVRDILVEKLHVKKVIIGYDHRFGRNRTATIDDLIEFGSLFNFEVEQIPAEEIDEVSISSTKIRNALIEGDIETANAFLGHSFMISGSVVNGKEVGRKIAFPTANLQVEEPYKLIPKDGVYVVESLLNGNTTYGMMNIGFNPTVKGTKKTIEIHFFGIQENLYNQKIRVHLLKRLRDEKHFDSLDALKNQLKKDKENALAYIQKRKN